MDQSEQRSERRQSDWEIVYSRTLDDGIELIRERNTSSGSEENRYTVQFGHGSALGEMPVSRTISSLTFYGTAELLTYSREECLPGKQPTHSA